MDNAWIILVILCLMMMFAIGISIERREIEIQEYSDLQQIRDNPDTNAKIVNAIVAAFKDEKSLYVNIP